MSLADRPSDLPKGDWGKLLILAGSASLSGAAVLTSLGALRTGVDLVVMSGPERAAAAVLAAAPDVVSLPLIGKVFDRSHIKLLEYFREYPVAMGPGMTLDGTTGKFVREAIKSFKGPFVIDADALRLLVGEKHLDKLFVGKQVVLTPNRHEYRSLVGDADAKPEDTIAALAKRLGVIIFCKGPVDLISDGTRVEKVNGGSSYLAKAGTGDVLTGVVGALLARRLPPFEAAVTAAKLLKDAGERAAKDRGPGMLATDVADALDLRRIAAK